MPSNHPSRRLLASTLSYLDDLMREVEKISLIVAWLIEDLADDAPQEDVLAGEVELMKEMYGFLKTYDV